MGFCLTHVSVLRAISSKIQGGFLNKKVWFKIKPRWAKTPLCSFIESVFIYLI